MAQFAVQLFDQRVIIEHPSDDLAGLRDELLRTRYLTGVVCDGDAHSAGEVLISASAIRWIVSVNG